MKNKIIEILENVALWETCPQEYKDDIQKFLDTDKSQQLNILGVSESFIFDKRRKEKIIFYNGKNKQEVIDFFKDDVYGKYIKIVKGKLDYRIRSWQKKTEIKPNNYIRFRYDEDDWYYFELISKKTFDENFIECSS